MPRAIAAAGKALELDPTLAEAHTSLGYARFWYEWNWPTAERSFKRALELNPAYGTARQWYAAYLQTLDRVDESLGEIDRALELDPLSLVFRTAREATLYLERRYDDVIAESTRTLEMDPGFVLAYFSLGRAYTHKKMHRQAIAELKKAHQLSGGSPAMTMQLGYAYAMAGKKPEAKKMIDSLKSLARKHYVPAFYFAGIYAGLRDKENALAWLAKAYEERCDYMFSCPRSLPRIRCAMIRASTRWSLRPRSLLGRRTARDREKPVAVDVRAIARNVPSVVHYLARELRAFNITLHQVRSVHQQHTFDPLRDRCAS
jgi:tetratricopeptide (TPR) repeat protein